MPQRTLNPLAVANLLRTLTDRVVIGLSGGKDSVAALDVCAAVGIKAHAYHMYSVPGLAVEQDYLRYLQHKYDIPLIQYPHPDRVEAFRRGRYCIVQSGLPPLKHRDVWEAARQHYGIEWVVTGEKKRDSLERRGMQTSWGPVQPARHMAMPLSDWSDRQVFYYLKSRNVRLHPIYDILGDGHGLNNELGERTLMFLWRHYPEDYQRLLCDFPLADAVRVRAIASGQYANY